jgi:hypothetical protein
MDLRDNRGRTITAVGLKIWSYFPTTALTVRVKMSMFIPGIRQPQMENAEFTIVGIVIVILAIRY